MLSYFIIDSDFYLRIKINESHKKILLSYYLTFFKVNEY